jgi:Ankyrin repeats (many copies)
MTKEIPVCLNAHCETAIGTFDTRSVLHARKRKAIAYLLIVVQLTIVIALTAAGCDQKEQQSSDSSTKDTSTNSKPEEITVDSLLQAWDAGRLPSSTAEVTAVGEQHLAAARSGHQPADFVFAAQMFMTANDYRRAFDAINEAVKQNPDVNGPHFALAKFYYRLAFFDAIRRNLYQAHFIAVADEPKDDSAITFKIELIDLLSKKHSDFETAVSALKINDHDQIAILTHLFTDMEGATDSEQESAKELEQKLGPPATIPIIQWNPDSGNQKILELAQTEMKAAASAAPMNEPYSEMEVVNPHEMSAIAARLNTLMKGSGSAHVGSGQNGQAMLDAAEDGDLTTVQALVSKGISVDTRNIQGFTALTLAARTGKVEVVQWLLANGAQVDARDGTGGTPLMWAAYKNQDVMVKFLLDHGADIDATAKDGTTALDAAIHKNATNAEAILRAAGADSEAGGPITMPGFNSNGDILLDNDSSNTLSDCTVTLTGGYKTHFSYFAAGDRLAIPASEFKRDDGTVFVRDESRRIKIIAEESK